MRRPIRMPSWVSRVAAVAAILGPGLITASAGNDAPGIATYAMVGSTYGYRILWVIIVVTLGGVVVQEMSARMGAVTGKGTADLIRERFGVPVTALAMICLLVANLGTTIGEFAGIAAGAELLGVSRYVSVPLAALAVGYLVLHGGYQRVEKVLLVLCMSALAYVVTAFIARPSWGEIARQAVSPQLTADPDYILSVLATIGTTITPWGIFYLQASVADKRVSLSSYKGTTRLDVVTGSLWGNSVSAFIIISTAATLFVAGVKATSAEEAALALVPLVGGAARYLFAVGLLGAALLAASVLPLSTTYAVCEAFGFERGLDRSAREAPIFYGLYIAMLVAGVLVVLVPGMPLFRIMVISQSMNAILLPILLILALRLANSRRLMGTWVNKGWQNVLAGALTIIISLFTVALFVSPML